MGSILDKVIGPDVVGMLRSQPHARAIVQPQTTAFGLLLRNLQPLAPPDPRPVPQQVALWQARAVLTSAGVFAQADAAIRAAGVPAASALWDYGNVIDRGSPTLAALGAALGLQAAQIDDLFRQAAAINL